MVLMTLHHQILLTALILAICSIGVNKGENLIPTTLTILSRNVERMS